MALLMQGCTRFSQIVLTHEHVPMVLQWKTAKIHRNEHTPGCAGNLVEDFV